MKLYTLYDLYPKLLKVVTQLQSEGWVFRIDNWTNGHNENDEWSFQFKSPRMKEFIYNFSPETTTISQFRNREAEILARDYRRNHEYSIQDQIEKGIIKFFLKNSTKTKPPKTKIQITL